MMKFILSTFIDDYGLAKYFLLICTFIVYLAFLALFNIYIYTSKRLLPKFLTSIPLFSLLYLFISMSFMSPYENIPIYGTDIQKSNLKRCTVGKTITLENIEDIMFDCKKHDLEMELKSITKLVRLVSGR